MRKACSVILRVSISVAAVAILLFIMRSDIKDILPLLKNAQGEFIFISSSLICVGIVTIALRFKKVLKIQDINISLNTALYLTLIGHFFNALMPSAIGGDIVKGYYASKKTAAGFEAFASVFADRFVGLLGVLTIAGFSLLFYGPMLNNRRIMYAVILMIIFSLIAVVLAFHPKLETIANKYKKLQAIKSALVNLRANKSLMAVAFVIGIGTQIVFISSVYFIAQSLSLHPPLMVLFLTLPIIWSLSMLPSINGLGIREGAFVYFLGPIVGREGAFAISLVWLGIGIFAIAIIGGIVYAFHQVYNSLLKPA